MTLFLCFIVFVLRVVGFARRPWSDDDLHAHVTKILLEHQPDADKELLEKFLGFFTYHQGHFEELDSYTSALERLHRIDAEWGVCANKLYYLAVPPQHYETIFQNVSAHRLRSLEHEVDCDVLEDRKSVV